MGSLPPQGGGAGGGSGTAGQVVRSSENEAFNATTSYANALVIDLQEIGDSILQIKNMSGTNSILYKIYASPKVQGVVPADGDDSWYNILNGSDAIDDPSLYNHDKEVSIPINGTSRESLSNKYAWARIQIKTSSGTATVKVWHRGTTPS